MDLLNSNGNGNSKDNHIETNKANVELDNLSGTIPIPKLTKADFVSGQEVRWCPGCGDYAILSIVQKVMPELGMPREKIVFVSGIGCSSRFPYYMNTYGFHTIHGRAPAIALGVKCGNPDLSVWLISGDGDSLSIGGNHFIHAIRRNLDINYLLFNNRIYGLTKGQYSPTSERGKVNKSAPMGVIERPINPSALALANDATFVARTMDNDVKHLASIIKAAAEHKGVSFVEIYQNCIIFNDGAFDYFSDRGVRSDRVLYLEHGKPMIFGKELNKGIRVIGMQPEVVTIGENGITVNDLMVHDVYSPDPLLAFMLARMEYQEESQFPQPVGIFRAVQQPTYEDLMLQQIDAALSQQGKGNLEKLFNSGDKWVVDKTAI
jgi:2-oxoglutarate/2-oxoacid ferredoxin oxidoreductase subunit beta